MHANRRPVLREPTRIDVSGPGLCNGRAGSKRMRIRHEVAWTAAGLAAIALLTIAYTRGAKVSVTTVALSFLLVVMVVAAFATRRVAVVLSILAFACFNFFFLPPTGTFTIAQPEDLVALCALLAVSLVASHLATQARRRAQEAIV